MRDSSRQDEETGPFLVTGQLLGRYRLLSLVASGGMAQIWAAKPESGGFSRTVALKVIRPEYSQEEEYRRMMIDEAAAAAAVRHPNVCEVYELSQHGETLFLAMEWVPGDSIAGLIRQRTQHVPLHYALSARVIADACAGLHAAHQALGPDGEGMNIVHRDISPQNILLSVQGHVKVTDFGIAKARDQIHAKTRTGEIKGKFAYISPEQVLGQQVDHRSDVYSMGCVLFVATLGLRPFGRGTHAVMKKIVKGDFKTPRELVPAYPARLEEVVVKALSRHPKNRFQDAEEMRRALEDWLAECGKVVTHADIAQAVTERLHPSAREQIRTLKHANQFRPNDVSARIQEEPEGSWDLQTAGSGLIQVPDQVREAVPLGGSKVPGSASDSFMPATQPSIAPAVPTRSRQPGDSLAPPSGPPTRRDRSPQPIKNAAPPPSDTDRGDCAPVSNTQRVAVSWRRSDPVAPAARAESKKPPPHRARRSLVWTLIAGAALLAALALAHELL